MFRYILIVMILKPIDATTILPETTNYALELIDFTLKIVENEFKDYQTVLVIDNERDLNAERFLEKYSQSQHQIPIYSIHLDNFTTPFDEFYSNYKPDLNIIFVDKDNYLNIDAIIFGIELFPFWNIRGTFLVVVEVPDEYEEDWLENAFRAFWERQALRVYICFWLNGVKLITYNPFLEDYDINISNETDLSLIFNQKLTNMYGYPLKAMYLDLVLPDRGIQVEENGKMHWIGFDGKFLECIVKVLNASLEVHRLSDDFNEDMVQNTDVKISQNVYFGILKDVFDFDMIFNAVVYFFSELEAIYLYEKDEMLILVPKEKQIPTYLYIFLIVKLDVWCATLSSLISVSLTIVIVKKMKRQNVDVGNVFLDNFRFLLNESPPARDRTYQERTLLILWIFHCIIFATLFQTLYMTSLVAPKYYPEMQTLEDLYKTKLKIGINEFAKFKLYEMLTGQDRQLLEHLVSEDLSKYAQNIDWIGKYDDDYGFMLSKINLYELFVRDKTAKKSYYILKETPQPGVQSYLVRRDKLYYPEIKMILSRIQDAGLQLYWRKYNYDLKKTKIDKKHSNKTVKFDGDNSVLRFEHLQSVFMLLIFGYVLAIFAFCFEILSKKCCK